MLLSNETKSKIYSEYNSFKENLYAGKSLKERKELDQFFTPPSLSIQMIEKFDREDLSEKKILDPTCGSGNLLAACLIAGASPKNLYGNDYDKDMVILCKERLNNLCDYLNLPHVPDNNIHKGNALKKNALVNWGTKSKDTVCQREEEIEKLQEEQAALTTSSLW